MALYPTRASTVLRRAALAAGLSGALLLGAVACGSDSTAGSGGTSAADTSAAETSAADTSAAETSAASSAVGTSGAESSAPESSAAESSAPASSTAESSGSASGAVGGACVPDQLKTTTPNVLTIATSEPVYEPWMVDNDPSNGKGFESAVAYAVADQLGFSKDQVTWTRVGFDEAIVKQDGWDFDINQFSIDDTRKKQVDFSSGYYDVSQVVITVKGSSIEKATTIAELKDAKLGAMNGTTSLTAVNDVIKPTNKPNVFDDNALAAQALQNGQIDGLVVDLPTGFYMVGAQLKDGVMVGQLPGTASEKEQFGLLLAKGSPLTECATKAVDALRADGTLQKLTDEWLGGKDVAPELK
ncbi:ABC transporter substrate-binding protein [Nakamurella lactea]|uniref:ABC transporter substrate-binding protein n=1 Tax=Nakamurella lactea TaxID=459515 RepID=UPI0003FEB4A9|nr:ABC transporter substrate-binding protein [Nakamurella lactea]